MNETKQKESTTPSFFSSFKALIHLNSFVEKK